MSKVTEYPGAAQSRSVYSDHCRWEVPDRGVRIHLSQETVDRLQVDVVRGIEGDDQVEVGGILLGRKELDEDGSFTLIEGFVAVPCEYDRGPFYCLSKKDSANFEAALTEHKGGASDSLSVVGYYRSHNRDDLYLSSDDLKLIHRYFLEQDKVFLLVKTLPSRACTAGFFFWEEGQIQTEFTYLEVPFGPIQSPAPTVLVRSNRDMVDEIITGADASTSNEQQPDPLPTFLQRLRRNRRAWPVRGLAAAVVIVVLSLAGLRYVPKRFQRQETSEAQSSNLGLQIHRNADLLAVTWIPNSPAVLSANEAVLEIRDGGSEKALHLDQVQLRSGTVSYAPSGDNIHFRLEIYRDGKPSSAESVQLLLPGAPFGVNPSAQADSTALEHTGEHPSKDAKLEKTIAARPDSTSSTTRDKKQDRPTAGLEAKRTSLEGSHFVPPASFLARRVRDASSARSVDEYDQPPSIPIEAKRVEEPLIASAVTQLIQPTFPAPPKPAPVERSLNENAAQSGPAAPVTSGKTPPRANTFVGPQLIRKANPAIPLELRPLLLGDIEIDVTVTIDAEGKVIGARVTAARGPGAGLIVRQVVQAAQLFLFRPARDNNRNVQSDMVLTFLVKPSKS